MKYIKNFNKLFELKILPKDIKVNSYKELLTLLEKYNIPLEKWGKTIYKTTNHLWNEILEKKCSLSEQNGELYREVNFVGSIVVYKKDGINYRLWEDKAIFKDGRIRIRDIDNSMSEKFKKDEIPVNALIRGMKEELGIVLNKNQFTFYNKYRFENNNDYPGIHSFHNGYRYFIAITDEQFNPDGYIENQSDKTIYFVWKKMNQKMKKVYDSKNNINLMKKYNEFLNERKKLDNDDLLDLYVYFMKILKIHEQHFYQDEKIANNKEFKEELNKLFGKLSQEKGMTEDLIRLITKYEKELYNDDKMIPEDNYGCSLWDICDVIVEDPETLDINDYIQTFSDNEIYVDTVGFTIEDFDELPEIISNLKLDIESSNIENDKIETVQALVNITFDNAKEKFTNYEENYEIKIIEYVIKELKWLITRYPKYTVELENQIKNYKKYKKKF